MTLLQNKMYAHQMFSITLVLSSKKINQLFKNLILAEAVWLMKIQLVYTRNFISRLKTFSDYKNKTRNQRGYTIFCIARYSDPLSIAGARVSYHGTSGKTRVPHTYVGGGESRFVKGNVYDPPALPSLQSTYSA